MKKEEYIEFTNNGHVLLACLLLCFTVFSELTASQIFL